MYCTLDDIKRYMPMDTIKALTQDDPTQENIDERFIHDAIEDVSERIDASLRGRYRLPFAQKSSFLKGIALDLVRHSLYMRRPDGGELPDGVVRAYKTANENLKAIADGDLSLGIQETQQPQPNHVWRVRVPERRFNR